MMVFSNTTIMNHTKRIKRGVTDSHIKINWLWLKNNKYSHQFNYQMCG